MIPRKNKIGSEEEVAELKSLMLFVMLESNHF